MQELHSQKRLRNEIVSQNIYNKTYHYSIAKKEQKSFSLWKNDRLLVLDFDDGNLFYVNQIKNLPFRTISPKPKAQYAQVEFMNYRHLLNTEEIEFTFKYANEDNSWKFVFETKELADQWIKLLEFQKQSREMKDRDNRALNKAIFEMPKIQKEYVDDIVKEPQRNIPNDQSRLLNQLMGNPRTSPSNIRPINESIGKTRANNWKDWNERFFHQRNIATLYDFQQAALDSFYKILEKDDQREDKVRNYQNESFDIKVANRFTLNAKNLKLEFRNYQFILEATNKNFIVGVPLACLFQFENIVGLVKARFPKDVESYIYDNAIKDDLHQLQLYTRIKNRIIQHAVILDLRKFYDPNSKKPLYYLQNLINYLPINHQFPNQLTLVRPQYMLDEVDHLVVSGPQDQINKNDIRVLKEMSLHILDKVKIFSQIFFVEDFKIVRISQLKNLMHQEGINMKYLPHVYQYCPNKNVKRYIYSAMIAKVVKDYVFQTKIKILQNDPRVKLTKVIQQTIAYLMQGNNNKSNELWKQLSLIFKRKFNITLNHKQILPGFFFNSILELIPCSQNLQYLDKRKKLFEETKIIQNNFIQGLHAKAKSFYRYLPPNIETLKKMASQNIKSRQTSTLILEELFDVQSKKYRTSYRFANNDQWMTSYLSLYFPPQNLADQNEDRINLLYDRINQQPPSYFSMNLTRAYLQWCNKKENTVEFKKVFDRAIEIADYWLDEIHPIRSELFELLSDYFSILRQNDDMIRYMKDSANICLKFWGSVSSQLGFKQYQLADRYLRAGKKRESIDCFEKSINNFIACKTKTNKHGLALMKLASIYLSDLEYDKAQDAAKQSLKSFEEYQKKVKSTGLFNEHYKIKTFEILARINEICDKKTDYKDLAMGCSKKFNNTKSKQVFEQMIRICLAGAIFKSTNERCESFLVLTQSLLPQRRETREQLKAAQSSFESLMHMSDDIIVMEKFIYKFEQFQRSLFELNNKKRILGADNQQFIGILTHVINIVGIEYIRGLVDQKISCSV